MPLPEVAFLNYGDQPVPVMLTLLDYKCNGKSGIILFEGFYHINNDSTEGPYKYSLPQQMKMFMQRRDNLQTLIPGPGLMSPIRAEYRIIEEHLYTIEIYKREIYTDLKYINRQTIYFHILDKDSAL